MLTPNRVVALLTPLVFAPLAGTVAALLASHFPGLDVDADQIQSVFIGGAVIALAPALQWLHGWQKYEARTEGFEHQLALASAQAEGLVAALPVEGDAEAPAADAIADADVVAEDEDDETVPEDDPVADAADDEDVDEDLLADGDDPEDDALLADDDDLGDLEGDEDDDVDLDELDEIDELEPAGTRD